MIRTCKNCGKEFHAYPSVVKKGHAQFCSCDCRAKYQQGEQNPNHKGGKYIACATCGKPFWVRPWEQKKGVKYCTKACYDEARRPGGPWAEHSVKCVCGQCGTEFFAFSSEIRKGGGKYCSRDCYMATMPLRVKRSCKTCGRTFWIQPANAAKGNGKFCSQSCASKLEHNNSWLGGISFGSYCPKFNKKFKEHIRDKFHRKCFDCGKTESENGKKLAVHHIDYNKNSICNGNEWAFVPLCAKHHAESNFNRWYWFSRLIHYWAMNPDINFNLQFWKI